MAPAYTLPRSLAAAALAVALLAGCGEVRKERPFADVVAAARAGEEAALRDLVSRLGHPDPQVAQSARDVVAELGPAAEKALIEALSSQDPDIAEAAAGALGGSSATAAIEPLVRALGTWELRRYVAAWALGEIGDRRAIPPLVAAMGDPDPEVRKYATRSLVKFGREATVALIAALDHPSPELRHYAVRALGEIRDERSVEPLLAAGGKVDRDVYLWALGRLGDPRGFAAVAAAVDDPDPEVRLAAIQALRDLGDPRAVPLLTRTLADPEWMIREWAARGLESITGNRYRYRNQHGEEIFPYALYR